MPVLLVISRADNHCGLFASAAASIKVESTGPDFPLDLEEVNRRAKTLAGG
jgi:hypothetical protein